MAWHAHLAMLNRVDPLLTAELLQVLAEIGHGDEVVIADAKCTAASLGQGKPVIPPAGAGMQRPCAAVLSLLPLDAGVLQPVADLQLSGIPDAHHSALQPAVIATLGAAGHATPAHCQAIDGFACHDRLKQAFATVHTGGLQPCANFILKQGGIAEQLRA